MKFVPTPQQVRITIEDPEVFVFVRVKLIELRTALNHGGILSDRHIRKSCKNNALITQSNGAGIAIQHILDHIYFLDSRRMLILLGVSVALPIGRPQ